MGKNSKYQISNFLIEIAMVVMFFVLLIFILTITINALQNDVNSSFYLCSANCSGCFG